MKKPSFAILFYLLLCGCAIMTLLLPQQAISSREQRSLQQLPKISWNTLLNGTFQADSEQALNDQFYLRSGFIALQRLFYRSVGMHRINDVWVTKDQLYQNTTAADVSAYQALIDDCNAFAQKNQKLRFDFLLVPTVNAVSKSNLIPADLYQDQRKDITWFSAQLDPIYHPIDTLAVMEEHADQYLYYKGDHHWTTLGAYTMFQAWQKQRGLKDTIAYQPLLVNDAFYGTLSNASGIEMCDQIEIYQSEKGGVQTLVTYVQEQKRTASVYDSSKQYSDNPYEIFLGGNYDRIDIKTTAETDRNLLLIKDSYANAFLPFLLPHYHTVIMIDPRYYYDTLQELIDHEGISDVLFLMNAATLFSDPSLRNLMHEEMH